MLFATNYFKHRIHCIGAATDEKEDQKLLKPTKTNLMKKENCRALRVFIGQRLIIVEAQSNVDGKKRLICINSREVAKGEQEAIQKHLDEYYNELEDKYELEDLWVKGVFSD